MLWGEFAKKNWSFFHIFCDTPLVARFFGFPNPATWVVYHEMTRNHRMRTLRAVSKAFELENGEACLHLEQAVREALRPGMSESNREAFLLADALVTESLRQVVWGELLVAFRWHFVGNPVSSQGDGASNRKLRRTTQETDGVRERSIVQDAINIELS